MALDARAELRVLIRLAAPTALSNLCRFGMGVTDLAVVGHLGSEYLAAASLSLVWQTVTSAFVLRGFAVAVNTLGGQALGAGHPKLAGMWLQVALVGVSIVMAPIALSWWFTEDVLLAAGLGARVSHLAGVFSRWSAFYALPSAWFPVAQAFFRCQGVVAPALVVNAVFLFVNALLNLVLVRGLFIGSERALGFEGSPLATAISRAGQCLFLFLVAVVWRGDHKRCWGGWSPRAFAGARLAAFARQAGGVAAGAVLEEWQLQALALLAARIGEDEVAAQNAMLNSFMFVTSLLFGIYDAANTRISFHLGRGRGADARETARLCLWRLFAPTAVAVSLAIVLARNELGKVFTSSPHVQRLTAEISWFVSCGYSLFSLFYTAMACLNSQGRPLAVAVAYLLGAWLVCLPLAAVLVEVAKLRLLGIWVALNAGYCVVTAAAGWAAWHSDWDEAAANACRLADERAARTPALPAGSLNDAGGARLLRGAGEEEEEEETAAAAAGSRGGAHEYGAVPTRVDGDEEEEEEDAGQDAPPPPAPAAHV